MNIKYARAATLVIAIIPATSVPAPSINANSSVSIRFSRPIKQTARVPTTFSFAINPVIAAAASCHERTPTIGTSRYANGEAIEARIDESALSATAKLQVKVCISCTAILQRRMMVAAFTM